MEKKKRRGSVKGRVEIGEVKQKGYGRGGGAEALRSVKMSDFHELVMREAEGRGKEMKGRENTWEEREVAEGKEKRTE